MIGANQHQMLTETDLSTTESSRTDDSLQQDDLRR